MQADLIICPTFAVLGPRVRDAEGTLCYSVSWFRPEESDTSPTDHYRRAVIQSQKQTQTDFANAKRYEVIPITSSKTGWGIDNKELVWNDAAGEGSII